MIEFNGELSKECKDYVYRRSANAKRAAFAITSILVLSIPFAFVVSILGWLIALVIFVPALLLVVVFLPMGDKRNINSWVPTKITIETLDDGIIESVCAKLSEHRLVADIKKIIDTGEWYYFIFYIGYKSIYFICQKNLITKGTLEEFEKLFEGKIVRKIN